MENLGDILNPNNLAENDMNTKSLVVGGLQVIEFLDEAVKQSFIRTVKKL